MSIGPRPQRIRDPVHNVITFDDREFEQCCWKLLSTAPMQRLRRVKQLGFSEFVYPGATHTRFSHCLGAFNTARQLAGIARRGLGQDRFDPRQAQVAIAAALIHDIGHGPFSHAFEDALKKIGVSKKHELRTRPLLDRDDVREAFEDFPDFPEKILEIIEAEFPRTIYASIVSSQFDADRLDYMRRDRMMSGTQQSQIDYDWLLTNLHVGKVPVGQDGKFVKKSETFVINQKAVPAAEGYIFSLLYLYVNVYFHKTTRGIEKLFSALIERVAQRAREGAYAKLNLSKKHPLVQFLRDPEDIDAFLKLDDVAIMGSLCLLAESGDPSIAELADRIHSRKIFSCVDVTKRMNLAFGLPTDSNKDVSFADRIAEVERRVARVGEMANERGLLDASLEQVPGVLEDTAPRSPYKQAPQTTRRLSRIHVLATDGKLYDLAEMSTPVNTLAEYKAYRLYARDESTKGVIESLIEEAMQ